jgi:hypothetical protein
MKNVARIFLLLVGLLLLSAQIQSALAQQVCTDVWTQAETVIAEQCNEYNPDNTLCYAHAPVSVTSDNPVSFSWFQQPGNLGPITTDLRAVQGFTDLDVGGFSWLKIISETNLPEHIGGQAVTLIAFGNTRLIDITNRTTAQTLNAGDVGHARLKFGSTTFGGSYIRVLPDPRFRIECYTTGCADKDNLLHFVEEGIEMGVKGRNLSGDSLLVHDDHATGWITSDPQYIEFMDITFNSLSNRIFDDRIIADLLNSPVASQLPIAHTFRFENPYSQPSSQCANENRPPGGLLIVNPSHQRIAFSINSISLVLASTVFLYQPFGSASDVTDVVVLQGEAIVDNLPQTAVAGEVVRVGQGPTQFIQSGGAGNWCQALYELAAAVYQPAINGVPVGVPVERISYCNSMPQGGYPLGQPVIG